MIKRSVALILLALAWSANCSMAQPPQPIVRNPNNPPLFQRFAAPPSATLRFLLSDRGRKTLRRLRTPGAIAFLKALGEDVTSQVPAAPSIPAWEAETQSLPEPELLTRSSPQPLTLQSPQTPVVNGCGPNGTVFNLEPAADAAPQFTESVDFFYNAIAVGADLVVEGANDFRSEIGTGYYVHTAATGCAPAFEGMLPDLVGLSGETVFSEGEPVVVTGAAHGSAFIADMRFGSNASGATTAIGLFRGPRANLLNTVNCPPGTHTAAQAKTCWPLGKLINPLPDPMRQYEQDSPGLAYDDASGHPGEGNAYVTGTEFDFNAETSRIWLVACSSGLTCSSPVLISGGDTAAQFSYVQVRPDGGITITYVQSPSNSSAVDIKYVACRAQGAPVSPSCAPPVLVMHETRPLTGSLIAEPFEVRTFPKHATRLDGGVTQTFVVWDRCKVVPPPSTDFCPDADLLMRYTTNNGATWTGPISVDVTGRDQFFPAVKTDSLRRTVNIGYYNNAVDPKFQHRMVVSLRQILPGTTTPTAAVSVTSTPNDPSSDLFFAGLFMGDYIGLAARGNGAVGGSRIYSGFSYNLRQGNYNGAAAPQADNYLSRLTY
jgi:hypothetical protein